MLHKLNEVVSFDKNTASHFFTKSYLKYSHLGDNLKFVGPVKIKLNTITQEDTLTKNIGRPDQHTPLELQNIAKDLSIGVKPYLDLPIAVKNNDPDVEYEYDLVAGFGTCNGLETNGIKEYWFYIVENATPSQIDEIATYENTSHLNDTKYNTGEKGVIHHIKNEIAKGHKELVNTEDSITAYIKRVWPGIDEGVLGRVLSKAKNAQTTRRTFQTYNPAGVKVWLSESADETAKFVFGGMYDTNRNQYGYLGANTMDPIINGARKYVETNNFSYVVLHVKDPGNKTVKQLRQNKIDQFNNMLAMFKSLGVKNTNFIKIRGFLPQDTKKEDMRFLVDVNGKSIK